MSTWFAVISWAMRSRVPPGMVMTRSMAGIGASPAFAAHQSRRRSMKTWLSVKRVTFQAPVVTGHPFSRSKKRKAATILDAFPDMGRQPLQADVEIVDQVT